MAAKLRIWDLPIRLFHWLLALAVVGLVITGYVGGNAMVWHFRLGHAVLALLLFRIVWGFVGGHWSRFGTFLYSPATTWAYLRGRGKPEHSLGHNPLGAGSVIAMLVFLAAQVATGLMSDDEIAFAGPLTKYVSGSKVSAATWYHKEVGQWIVIGLVVLHIVAIFWYLLKRRDNLVQPMLTGDKAVDVMAPASRDTAGTRIAALVLLALAGGVAAWVHSLGA